jgi:hypothetical protein
MVLGIQWLESLGPNLWDFKKRTMAFVRDGQQVLSSTTEPALLQSLVASQPYLMENLLIALQSLFAEPQGLPPPRLRAHKIRLMPGTKPVATPCSSKGSFDQAVRPSLLLFCSSRKRTIHDVFAWITKHQTLARSKISFPYQ